MTVRVFSGDLWQHWAVKLPEQVNPPLKHLWTVHFRYSSFQNQKQFKCTCFFLKFGSFWSNRGSCFEAHLRLLANHKPTSDWCWTHLYLCHVFCVLLFAAWLECSDVQPVPEKLYQGVGAHIRKHEHPYKNTHKNVQSHTDLDFSFWKTKFLKN